MERGEKGNWFKDCEICNVGLCATIDRMKKETDLSLNKICEKMSKECGSLYSAGQIKQRYLYHKGISGRKPTTPKTDLEKWFASIKNCASVSSRLLKKQAEIKGHEETILEQAEAIKTTLEKIMVQAGYRPGSTPTSIMEKIRRVYRQMAVKWHPDKNGGNTLVMQAINEFKDLLMS